MASPFPGMDPYLEDPAFWRDFHPTFLGCWREAIADLLPEAYEARLDESVNLIQMSNDVIRLLYPDLAITRKRNVSPPSSKRGGTLLLEPVTISHEFLEEVKQTRIEVLHRPDRKLVGILEMLSPTNKTGEGYQEYRSKRKAVLLQKVHLVELDLLLGGRRLPLLEPLPPGDYYAMVSRANNYMKCEVYSWFLRHPLPTIPIPLKTPDADIHVDLAKVFQVAYERGRYARSLAYGKPPVAPLKRVDAQWAKRISARK
jgi:Protein of unknown function (DUF4058)